MVYCYNLLLLLYCYFCEGIGFQYDWEAQYTVTDITSGGPADKILRTGDKITQVRHRLVIN